MTLSPGPYTRGAIGPCARRVDVRPRSGGAVGIRDEVPVMWLRPMSGWTYPRAGVAPAVGDAVGAGRPDVGAGIGRAGRPRTGRMPRSGRHRRGGKSHDRRPVPLEERSLVDDPRTFAAAGSCRAAGTGRRTRRPRGRGRPSGGCRGRGRAPVSRARGGWRCVPAVAAPAVVARGRPVADAAPAGASHRSSGLAGRRSVTRREWLSSARPNSVACARTRCRSRRSGGRWLGAGTLPPAVRFGHVVASMLGCRGFRYRSPARPGRGAPTEACAARAYRRTARSSPRARACVRAAPSGRRGGAARLFASASDAAGITARSGMSAPRREGALGTSRG